MLSPTISDCLIILIPTSLLTRTKRRKRIIRWANRILPRPGEKKARKIKKKKARVIHTAQKKVTKKVKGRKSIPTRRNTMMNTELPKAVMKNRSKPLKENTTKMISFIIPMKKRNTTRKSRPCYGSFCWSLF